MPLRKYLKRWANPAIWGFLAIIVLWLFLAISIRHFWTEPHHFNYKLFSVHVYIGSLLIACIVVTVHSYYIFYKKDFHYWFSNVAFLFFVLTQLLMMINALTMPAGSKLKLKFCIEGLVIFLFMCLYTQAVTMQNRVLRDLANIKVEEKQLAVKRLEEGCVTIPLKPTHSNSELPTKPRDSKVQFKEAIASTSKGKK